jgi:hypothetical protein
MRTAVSATIVSLSLFFVLSQSASAQYPPKYTILRAPTSPSHHHPPMRGVREGYVNPKMRRSYAYGWFGAKSNPQWTRHFGYYGKFTQWSRR